MNESRFIRAFRAMVREMTAPFAYHGLVRYRVIETVSGRLSLQVVTKSSGFPDALAIGLQTGSPGASGELQPGAVVLVAFVEGNQSLPVVTHCARTDDGAFVPLSASLDASGTVTIGASASAVQLASGTMVGVPAGHVVCYGDTVTVGTATGAIATVLPFSKVKAQ